MSNAGLPPATFQKWQAAEPESTGDFAGDGRNFSAYWQLARELLAGLPAKPARGDEQTKVAETIHQKARAARQRFLGRHAASVYEKLTQNYSKFLRVEALALAAADAFPGLVDGFGDLPCNSSPPAAGRQARRLRASACRPTAATIWQNRSSVPCHFWAVISDTLVTSIFGPQYRGRLLLPCERTHPRRFSQRLVRRCSA